MSELSFFHHAERPGINMGFVNDKVTSPLNLIKSSLVTVTKYNPSASEHAHAGQDVVSHCLKTIMEVCAIQPNVPHL